MKSIFLKVVAFSFLGAAGLSSANAYDQPRAHFGGEPSTPDDLRILARFSRCVADRQGNHARAILAQDYRSHDSRSQLRRLAESNWGCAPLGELIFCAVLFAGGLAENLLAANLRQGDLAAHVALDPARAPIAARDENEMMSLCTVRAAPNEVTALLRSEAASPQEAAALTALIPHVTSCLAAGQRLSLNRPFLRAVLVLAAYRLSDHNGWTRVEAAAH
jgi:hypothetical protein